MESYNAINIIVTGFYFLQMCEIVQVCNCGCKTLRVTLCNNKNIKSTISIEKVEVLFFEKLSVHLIFMF